MSDMSKQKRDSVLAPVLMTMRLLPINAVMMLLLVACGDSLPAQQPVSTSVKIAQPAGSPTEAVDLIARGIDPQNKLSITASQLKSKQNPKGEGTFVYVSQTRFVGVERYLIWLTFDGQGYALNGPSKETTPQLPWPRDAAPDAWKRTNLDPYIATEAIKIVFGQ